MAIRTPIVKIEERMFCREITMACGHSVRIPMRQPHLSYGDLWWCLEKHDTMPREPDAGPSKGL